MFVDGYFLQSPTNIHHRIARAKSHAIYTDTTLNSNDIVCTNIHQAFVLTAMKMHAYIRAAGHAGGLFFVPSRDRERRRRFKNSRSNKQSASFLLGTHHLNFPQYIRVI